MKNTVKDERKGLETSLSENLLKRICDKCEDFRTGEISKEKLLNMICDILWEDGNEYSSFMKGFKSLRVMQFDDDAVATFFCLVEHFFTYSAEPMKREFFQSSGALMAFLNGIDTLVAEKLAIYVAINTEDKEREDRERYMISPKACRQLVAGGSFIFFYPSTSFIYASISIKVFFPIFRNIASSDRE